MLLIYCLASVQAQRFQPVIFCHRACFPSLFIRPGRPAGGSDLPFPGILARLLSEAPAKLPENDRE